MSTSNFLKLPRLPGRYALAFYPGNFFNNRCYHVGMPRRSILVTLVNFLVSRVTKIEHLGMPS